MSTSAMLQSLSIIAATRCAALLLCASIAAPALAQQSIKVLWYRYASPTSHYAVFAHWLGSNAHLFQQSSGLRWELTFFGPGDAPDFTRYNALVIESGEAFRTGPNRNLDVERVTPDYSGILENKAAILAARGERTFISATDGDYHALRGDSGSAPESDTRVRWDGARGHFINAVNWAGSGKGLGIVVWCDCEFPGAAWWQHADSFLRNELAGRVKYFRDNAPSIAPAAAQLYLNHGITTQGLSNWQVSFHGGFRLPVPGYAPVVMSGAQPGYAVAIASSAAAHLPAGPAPSFQFVVHEAAVHENDGAVQLSVARRDNRVGAVSVDYASADGSAVAGQDYAAASGSLFFDNGEWGPKTITLSIKQDRFAEGGERFALNLRNPTNGAVLGADASATIVIADAGGEAVASANSSAAAPARESKLTGGCSLTRARTAFDPLWSLLLAGAWIFHILEGRYRYERAA